MTKEKSKISKEEVRIGQEELSGLEANILDKPQQVPHVRQKFTKAQLIANTILDKPQQVPHVRLLNKKYEELEENR